LHFCQVDDQALFFSQFDSNFTVLIHNVYYVNEVCWYAVFLKYVEHEEKVLFVVDTAECEGGATCGDSFLATYGGELVCYVGLV
jgi:hypothetical protein